MAWPRAVSIGTLLGAGCGILLATPVALTDPTCRMGVRSVGDTMATIGIWAVGGVVCGAISTSVIRAVDTRMLRSPASEKRLLQSRHYWQLCFGLLILAACASLIPFCHTLGAYRTDGEEVVGWPHPFYFRGGFSYLEGYRLDNLMIDIGVWTTLAVSAASVARKGTRRISIRVILWLRNSLAANRRS
jgi:hypothetical protein